MLCISPFAGIFAELGSAKKHGKSLRFEGLCSDDGNNQAQPHMSLTSSATPSARHPITLVSPADGLITAQIFATVVISVAVLLFSVGCCRPFDPGCCSSKSLGLGGGILMVIYAVLQLIAFSLAAAVTDAGKRTCSRIRSGLYIVSSTAG